MVKKYIDREDGLMSYKEIAEILTKDEGVEYTEEQVRQIACRAMKKLRTSLDILAPDD